MSDGKQAVGAFFDNDWQSKSRQIKEARGAFARADLLKEFCEAYHAAQIARHTETDEQELRHYRELDASDPYEYRCGPCCGDAHMLLETSLEHIKTLGFEVETIAKESITEIHWHNRRAEKAEAELIARHSAAPDGGSDKVKECLKFIRQCVAGRCDQLDLEVIRGEIDGVLAEGHSAAEPRPEKCPNCGSNDPTIFLPDAPGQDKYNNRGCHKGYDYADQWHFAEGHAQAPAQPPVEPTVEGAERFLNKLAKRTGAARLILLRNFLLQHAAASAQPPICPEHGKPMVSMGIFHSQNFPDPGVTRLIQEWKCDCLSAPPSAGTEEKTDV